MKDPQKAWALTSLEYAPDIDPNDIDHQLLSDPSEVSSQLEVELNQARLKHLAATHDNPAWDQVKTVHIPQKDLSRVKKHGEDSRLLEAVGLANMRGKRPTMEDSHLSTILEIPYQKHILQAPIIAIFDGHGGAGCAKFMQENLGAYLKRNLPLALKSYGDADTAIYNGLVFTCNQLNDDFKRDLSGTTANITLIIDRQLWVANMGDTRAILCQGSDVVILSEDARSDEQSATEGIEKRGGRVIAGRVEGQIQVACAIGDIGILGISHRPKISKYLLPAIPSKDLRLVIACDGLWDVASSSQVAQDVAKLNHLPPKQIASYLVHKAYKAGSQDNISVFVVDVPKLPTNYAKGKKA
jgi:serine/threonine protein phosphatase PrpC